MNDLDRSTVVMSIRPAFANRLIIDQTKLWEWRTRPLPDGVKQVIVYRSGASGQRGLIGEFYVHLQRKWTAQEILDGLGPKGWGTADVHPALGISLADLARYAGGWGRPIWGIAPRRPVFAYDAPRPLSKLGFDRAPQSWRYAPAGWFGMLS